MKELSGLTHLQGKDDLLRRLEDGQNEKQYEKAQIIDRETYEALLDGPNAASLAATQVQLLETLKDRTKHLNPDLNILNQALTAAPVKLEQPSVVKQDKQPVADAGVTEKLTPNEVVAAKRAQVKSQFEKNSTDTEAQTELERIIGVSDLLPLWYLSRGLQAARAVGVVCVNGIKIGTGFLVGKQLLLTNNHVIGQDSEGTETVEFDYVTDETDQELPSVSFTLNRDLCFITSPENELDFTLIGVDEVGSNNTELEQYGYLRLNPKTGKIKEMEAVAVIGHPNGKTKQVALRDNRVLQIGYEGLEHCLWYTTDTLPGNSGSPVFNDQWQVVALHHKAIPQPCNERQGFKTPDGRCVDMSQLSDFDDSRIVWLANEGIRISTIVEYCRQESKTTTYALVGAWLNDIDTNTKTGTLRRSPVVTFSDALERQREPDPTRFDGRKGYDPDFLKANEKTYTIPLFDLTSKEFGPFAQVEDGGYDLNYMHSTIRMNKERKLAYFTAVNINGKSWISLKREKDVWEYDPRLGSDEQIGPAFYSDEPGIKGWFDRGHLIRRLDPVWGDGDEPETANDDTFVWTNCSPQHWSFNQSDQYWQGIENFILTNVAQDGLLASVFSGPVFKHDDEIHRGELIPQAYWKIVAVLDQKGQLHTSAYLVPQVKFAQDIPFERIPVGQFKGFQISIEDLEKLTRLAFGDELKNHDAWKDMPQQSLKGFESMRWRRPAAGA